MPPTVPSELLGCPGSSIEILATAPTGTRLEWYDTNGNLLSEDSVLQSPIIGANEATTYEVIAVNAYGCASAPASVTVAPFPLPVVNFVMTPDEPIVNELVQFTNQTIDPFGSTIVEYAWSFGDGAESLQEHPEHTYLSEGLFVVTLTVTNAEGCSSSLSKEVYVKDDPRVFFPNAFSPNADGINDLFELYVSPGILDFELHIFNRWGREIFSTREQADFWNGRINNSGALCPEGVYTYLLNYRLSDGEGQKKAGSITLIR